MGRKEKEMREPKYIPRWEVPDKCQECLYWVHVKCVSEACVVKEKPKKYVAMCRKVKAG